MARRVNMQEQMMGGPAVMVGSEGGASTFVSGEQLKQLAVPVETLLGAANGAVSGLVVSGLVSAAVTVAKNEGSIQGIGKVALQNIFGTHLGAVIAGTAAFAALDALVRFSRASKHNEWSERQYAALDQASRTHAEREEARKNDVAGQQVG